MPNRLANETSPYLLQHAHNPVEWYPWGPEALERARAEQRPILLSVGYSACHWCHVMERESFENADTAALMNDLFVNVKVDREERPDVDSIYMTAVQQMTGQGGWPMTMFLTPSGEPFYGGTYYPPEPRYGMPSFRQVLRAVAEAWRERRAEVEQSAGRMREALAQSSAVRPAPGQGADAAVLDAAHGELARRFDERWGGFGGAPKFPQPMILEFLLRRWKRTGDGESLRMAEVTLRRMADGGMYDHAGGGFARYSTDARWLVPHFEKMLYDNALLARAYLHAWQATHDDEHRRVVEETLAWVEREMTSPEGGFYSALDADSEGEEGKFYLWTPGEVDELLGPEDGPLFRRYYDVSEAGNFEGKNILHTARGVDQVAAAGVAPERLREAIERGRRVLYEARAKRVWPGLDDKILTSWNAMMLHAFAEGARVFERADWLRIAVRSAELLTTALRPDGRLLRTWKGGRAKIPAFLEDHALLADALVAVYEATWDARWVREAVTIADDLLARFWTEDEGVFYDTASDAEALVIRPRDVFDNATPSGTSAAAMALLRLGEVTGEARYRQVAERVLAGMGDLVARVPLGFGHLLCALDFSLSAPTEVAFVGDPASEEMRALVRTVSRVYLPNAVLAGKREEDEEAAALIPLLREREAIGGRATAYVCERLACRMPVTDPEALARQLAA